MCAIFKWRGMMVKHRPQRDVTMKQQSQDKHDKRTPQHNPTVQIFAKTGSATLRFFLNEQSAAICVAAAQKEMRQHAVKVSTLACPL
jgi:hypothetical protein